MTLSLTLSTAILVLITMGSGVMSLAIFKTQKIITLLNRESTSSSASGKQNQSWYYLLTLMIFFLGGYCLAVFLIAHEKFDWLPLLTGTVFFFGALFVLFSVSLYKQTLCQLMISQANYREESKRVASALAQVQHTQTLLIHNEKMLSLGQLSAGIAHEINNPVNFIHGNLRHIQTYANDLFTLLDAYKQAADPANISDILSLEDEIDLAYIKPDLAKILTSMAAGTQRIRQIVASMRTFSRLDESQYKQTDLVEGLESAVVMLQSRLQEGTLASHSSELEIIRDYSKLPTVECNHGAVNQVFLHILTNAADAIRSWQDVANASQNHADSDAQSPQIRVSARQLNEQWVQVAIADNGPGISAPDLHHIFDPFFTTKSIGKGTGLGLSISHQIIVEQHKGRLQCQSEPGKGSTFTIDLPVRRAAVSR